jgi:hypothetical protein
MTGTLRVAAIMFSAAIAASTGATAYAKARNLDAYAQAPRQESDMDIRKECYEQANKRWSSTNQDLQKVRDFAYSTCVFERGVRNP